MKYFFSIARYKDDRQKIFDDVFSIRNKEYCDRHGYKYVVIDNNQDIPSFRNHPSWHKPQIVGQLLDSGKLVNGDSITWIDADQLIVNIDIDFTSKKTMSYAIDSCNSHCNSFVSFNINEWSKKYIKELLSEERWNRLWYKKSRHEGFPQKFDSFYLEFYEQAMMYTLFGIKRHSDISFWELPNFGWYSDVSEDTIFSLNDLHEHVEVWPTSYNVTSFPGEYEGMFFLNAVEKQNVITRHFAGGQDWNNYKNWI